MRASKALKKILDGGCVRVCALGHYLPFYVRHAAHRGFDVIWLDLEHRAMGQREVQSLLALCHQFDIDCMVRAPTQERTRLYRYFEDGAAGLMMPLVEDADEARRIVRAVKFPPLGNRGLDGAGLDADFLLGSEGYTEAANRETFLVVQIETPQALEAVDQIAAVDGVDLLFVGPADLGLRLGLAGGPDLETATVRVAAAAARHGKAWGIAGGSPEDKQRWRGMGAQLLVGTGDFALAEVLRQAEAEFDAVLDT